METLGGEVHLGYGVLTGENADERVGRGWERLVWRVLQGLSELADWLGLD